MTLLPAHVRKPGADMKVHDIRDRAAQTSEGTGDKTGERPVSPGCSIDKRE